MIQSSSQNSGPYTSLPPLMEVHSSPIRSFFPPKRSLHLLFPSLFLYLILSFCPLREPRFSFCSLTAPHRQSACKSFPRSFLATRLECESRHLIVKLQCKRFDISGFNVCGKLVFQIFTEGMHVTLHIFSRRSSDNARHGDYVHLILRETNNTKNKFPIK